MLFRRILYYGKSRLLFCDARCDEAYGRHWPINKEKSWPAPEDPGTYEGVDGKPRELGARLNRWCARECERSHFAEVGEGIAAWLSPDEKDPAIQNIPDLYTLGKQE